MSNPWQARYLALLDDVCRRPGVYVGRPHLRLVRQFMDGYEMGLTDAGCSPDLDGLGPWVCLRFGICDPAWSTTRILVHAHGSQLAAIAAYPRVVRQFLAERAELGGPDSVRAAARERFPAGGPGSAPPDSHTSPDD